MLKVATLKNRESQTLSRTRKNEALELSNIKTQIKLNAQYSREEEIEEGIEKEKRRRIKEIIFDILFMVLILAVFGFILVLAGSMLGMIMLVIACVVVSALEILTYIVVDIMPMKKMRPSNITSKGEVRLGATIIGLNIFSLLVICFSLNPSAEFSGGYTHSGTTTIAELSLFLQFFVGLAILLHGLCTVRYVEMAIGFLFIPWSMFACFETATILHSKGIQTADLLLTDIILIFLILTTGILLGVTLIWDGKRKQ